jgi:putative IMPACT (imprinted ancient) family translation regulator
VRYFGGTKLGIPGLINAYKSASADAIENSQIITKIAYDYISITFDYKNMNLVMRIVKEEKIEMLDQQSDILCTLKLGIRKSQVERIIMKFKNIKGLSISRL